MESSTAVTQNLVPCQLCGRKFNSDRVAKHESICKGIERVTQPSPSPSSSSTPTPANNTNTSSNSTTATKSTKKTAKWKKQHEQLQKAMKTMHTLKDAGIINEEGAPIPTVSDDSDDDYITW